MNLNVKALIVRLKKNVLGWKNFKKKIKIITLLVILDKRDNFLNTI